MNDARKQALTQINTNFQSPQFRSNLAQALPAGVSVDRFTRVAMTAIQQNPDLLNKDRNSLYLATTQCAQAGLELDGKQAALVAFGDKVQFMPMIGGLRKIAAKYGVTIATGVVHDADHFEFELGVHPTMTHRPPKLGTDRGQIIGVWAQALDAEGRTYLEVMDVAQVEAIRAISRARGSGPWVSQWGEMARKTVARRLWKSLPLYDMDERESGALASAEAAEFDTATVVATQAAQEPAATSQAASGRPGVLDRVAAAGRAQEPAGQAIDAEVVDVTDGQQAPVQAADVELF